MLIIRKAKIQDARLLSQLLETSYRFYFSDLWNNKDELKTYISEESSIENIVASLETPDHHWFIAESHQDINVAATGHDIIPGNIIGFSKIVLNQLIPDKDFTGIYLHKLYLTPHLTGKKYGDQLFDHIVAFGQERGQKWLWLEVLEKNPKAIRFYARKGMEWQKDIIFSSETQQSTMHIMAKNLSLIKME
ncbi:GNAT family N-acetyltransferase [Xenorhabdus sp. M]|uniref:GNAT family N-acetyltransferase n=1 Tax=Xenorhabdus szentirmaii TaxID=290112 RepID=A0AAW3YQE1_9GAMM|nr:GNAT family N-acetyltransferase [Xenorhabdus sp. M]MBD2800130.1 GNAT family N-acetyltransferase [Xenorhabdus sp. M]